MAFFLQSPRDMNTITALRLLPLTIGLLLASACHDGAPRTEPRAPAVSTATDTSTQSPVDDESGSTKGGETTDRPATGEQPSHPDLVLLSPAAGDKVVGNPVTITGRARTFENNVVIELRDESGERITTAWTTATGEMGTLNPFSKEVWLTRDPGARLTIDLIEHSARDGSLRALTRRTVDFGGETVTETLMFPVSSPGNDCTRVKAVQREIPAAQGRLRAILEALIAGPTADEAARHGVASQFPRGSSIRGVDIDGTRAIVDFGPELSNVGGSCRALALRASIEQTITRVAGIDQVEIRAMGDAATALQP